MRDDSSKWPPAPEEFEPIQMEGCVLEPVKRLCQTLLSGPNVLTHYKVKGWPDILSGPTYHVALRRDRLLKIGGTPACQTQWLGEYAESDASALYTVFDLVGPSALELMKRGTEISLNTPSKSVMRQLFGLQTVVYRYEAETKFRIHIEKPFALSLAGSFKAAASLM